MSDFAVLLIAAWEKKLLYGRSMKTMKYNKVKKTNIITFNDPDGVQEIEGKGS